MLRDAKVEISHFSDRYKLSTYVRLNRYLLEAQCLVAVEGESTNETENAAAKTSLADVQVMEKTQVKPEVEYMSTK